MKIEIPKGWPISRAAEHAKDYARKEMTGCVLFDFNGVQLTVFKDSNIHDVCYIYQLEQTLRMKR